MNDDPIVKEVREAGARLAKEANFDIHTLCQLLREREKRSGVKVVSLS